MSPVLPEATTYFYVGLLYSKECTNGTGYMCGQSVVSLSICTSKP